MGQGAGAVNNMLPAKEIIREMVEGCVEITHRNMTMFRIAPSL